MSNHIIHTGYFNNGKPYILVDGKKVNVRRIEYIKKYGKLLPTQKIKRNCQEPRCINPEHMRIVHYISHLHEIRSKSQLSEKDKEEIFLSILTDRQLARKYNVSKSTINRIRTKRDRPHNHIE